MNCTEAEPTTWPSVMLVRRSVWRWGTEATAQAIAVALLHEIEAHAAPEMSTVEVKSTVPKCRPVTVTEARPVPAKLPMTADELGAS